MVIDSTEDPDSADARRRKSTLICRVCGHVSPITGDWIRRPSGDEVLVVCPDCGSVLAKRPRDDATSEERRFVSC